MLAVNLLSIESQQILIEKLQVAYLILDEQMCVKAWSSNLAIFGIAVPEVGDQGFDKFDFLVGFEVDSEIELPVVESSNGAQLCINLIPNGDELNVLIWDVSHEYEQQQLLQQKANEVQLLLHQKKKLLTQLNLAKDKLEYQNQQLKEASRLQTAFMSGISHEFRTPLTSIIGYNDLLDKISGNTEYTSAIGRSSKHLLSLVENLLDHGKFDSNELTIFPEKVLLADIFEDVKAVLSPLAQAKNIQFDIDCDICSSLFVYVDEVRLRQCLINVVSNAIKFTDKGRVVVTVAWQNDELEIKVHDTGLGIAEDDLDRVFLSFWQAEKTGKAGTGLGLTITKRIVEMMGGELSVSSQLEKGTTVSFNLTAPKIVDPDCSLTSDALLETSTIDSKKRILIAEDDHDIAELLMLLLQESGLDVECVVNGELAVEALKKANYDLVLMDLHMPVMGGYEAIKKIRQFNSEVSIIVTTASAVEAEKIKADSVMCNGYLVKPLDVKDIVDVVNKLDQKYIQNKNMGK